MDIVCVINIKDNIKEYNYEHSYLFEIISFRYKKVYEYII